MLNLGCHLSIGANTFQFFSRNPQGGAAKKINSEDSNKLRDIMNENGFAPILAHSPYTINFCSGESRIRDFARIAFGDDLKRISELPCHLYNLHPGSHVGQGIGKGIEMISEILNEYITEDLGVYVLLETMSGKGSEVGSRFEELREIRDRVIHKKWVGICIDSCHIYSAGYDIVSDPDRVFTELDNVIGTDRIMALHLNDSKYGFNSKKDRHEKLGEGTLGTDALMRFITHEAVKGIPILLETPNEVEGYKREIELIKSITGDN